MVGDNTAGCVPSSVDNVITNKWTNDSLLNGLRMALLRLIITLVCTACDIAANHYIAKCDRSPVNCITHAYRPRCNCNR